MNAIPTKILGIGNALVDSEYSVTDEQLTQTGLTKGNMTLASETEQLALIAVLEDQHLQSAHRASGGAGANSIFAATSLGAADSSDFQALYLCRVGNDESGKFYLADLQQGGVTTLSAAMVQGEVTGSCMVLVTPDGERTMQTFLGTSAALNEDNIDITDLIAKDFGENDWLYIEGYLAFNPTAQNAVLRLKKLARDKQMKIAVSFADPAVVKFGREGLDGMLEGGVDAVFCNSDEAMIFTSELTHEAAAQALLAVAKLAVVTDGAAGTCIASNQGLIKIATPQVSKVIDTNGAGDNFAGAFLYGLSQGYDLATCGELASHIASHVVQNFGARLDKQTYAAIKNQLIKHDPSAKTFRE